jgi:hypothetical protein
MPTSILGTGVCIHHRGLVPKSINVKDHRMGPAFQIPALLFVLRTPNGPWASLPPLARILA